MNRGFFLLIATCITALAMAQEIETISTETASQNTNSTDSTKVEIEQRDSTTTSKPVKYTNKNDIVEKRYKVNTAFAPGERLVYDLKYGFAKGGELDVQLGLDPIGYGYLFHAVAHCYTTGIIKKAVYVDDIYESLFDISTGEPVKSIRNVTENNYRRYNEVLFCKDSTVIYSLKSGRHTVPEQVFDIVSAFYYARRFVFDRKFEKNESMNLYTWFNEDLYLIKLRYKKTERIRTKFGKIECLKFVPVIDNDSPFKDEEGMEAWFTNDGNFVPVKIVIDLPISHVKAELKSFENLKNKDGLLKIE
ncbi:MAG: DUF3108 domain-containing protein [Bacteroidales bacterium]|nr:DUF3108 domain-containing protein [Bacteroidales bacterium]MCR5697532.1 DUF3108 domain-containing protein [Marinilabiliaceae bacterium]